MDFAFKTHSFLELDVRFSPRIDIMDMRKLLTVCLGIDSTSSFSFFEFHFLIHRAYTLCPPVLSGEQVNEFKSLVFICLTADISIVIRLKWSRRHSLFVWAWEDYEVNSRFISFVHISYRIASIGRRKCERDVRGGMGLKWWKIVFLFLFSSCLFHSQCSLSSCCSCSWLGLWVDMMNITSILRTTHLFPRRRRRWWWCGCYWFRICNKGIHTLMWMGKVVKFRRRSSKVIELMEINQFNDDDFNSPTLSLLLSFIQLIWLGTEIFCGFTLRVSMCSLGW